MVLNDIPKKPLGEKTYKEPWPSGFWHPAHIAPAFCSKSVGHVFCRTRRIHLILIRIIISLVPCRRLRANAISDFYTGQLFIRGENNFKYEFLAVDSLKISSTVVQQ